MESVLQDLTSQWKETSWYEVSSWNCSDSNYDHHIFEVPFYEVKQVIQWIVVVSFLCMSIQIPVNLMLHLKNIRNRLVGLPLFLVCYVGGRLIFYAIRKIPRIPGSQVFLKNAVVISIVMVLVSYIGSVLMWKYRKS